MRLIRFVGPLLLLALGAAACSKKVTPSANAPAPAPTTPAPTTTTTTTAPPAAPAAVAPRPAFDPFQSGYCEVSVDGATPTKTPGGMMNISSGHWPTRNMKAPSWPLLMNCGALSLSASGKLEEVPMKAGKMPIATDSGKPGVITPMMVFKPEGEMNIAAWDNNGIKGTFQFKGMRNGKDTHVKGTFDFKCPYAAKMGDPCTR